MSAPHNVVDAIGFTAATLTTVALVPQLVRVWRLRSAREISLGMFLMFSLGVTLWLIYGIALHAMPVVLANAVTLVLSLAILGLKLRFDSHATDKDQPDGAPR
jgi:MtN3 and saliva related transmembrane protein